MMGGGLDAQSDPRQSPRVLVIDDDPLHVELVREILEPLKLDIHDVGTARAGYEFIQREPPALILLDRMLHGENGLDLLKRLHADTRLVTIPVIMQTSCSSMQDLRDGFDAGAAYYVTKPLDHDLLRSVVRGALRSVEQLRPQKRATFCLQRLREGRFEFRTLEDALELASQLSQFCPQPELATMGLSELMINAVEHGNLEISYAEKSALCRANAWPEEVTRRLGLPAYKARVALIHVQRSADKVRFEIRDEGPGFDWRAYIGFQPERAFDPNGRGIALAQQMSFDSLRYEEPGNVVVAEVLLRGRQ